jgi:hypothetical protein
LLNAPPQKEKVMHLISWSFLIASLGLIWFGLLALFTGIGYDCRKAPNVSKIKTVLGAGLAIAFGVFIWKAQSAIEGHWATIVQDFKFPKSYAQLANTEEAQNILYEEINEWSNLGFKSFCGVLVIWALVGYWVIGSLIMPIRGWPANFNLDPNNLSNGACIAPSGNFFASAAGAMQPLTNIFFIFLVALFLLIPYAYVKKKNLLKHTVEAEGQFDNDNFMGAVVNRLTGKTAAAQAHASAPVHSPGTTAAAAQTAQAAAQHAAIQHAAIQHAAPQHNVQRILYDAQFAAAQVNPI